MRPSLNRRLVTRLVAGTVLVWCMAVGWIGWRGLYEADGILDRELVRTTASIFAVVPDASAWNNAVGLSHRQAFGLDASAQHPAIVLRDARGQLLIHDGPLPALAFEPGDAHYHSVAYGQRRWRVFQSWNGDRRYWVQVAVPLGQRNELMHELLAPILLVLLVLVPPAVFAGLRGGLKPLHRLTGILSASTVPLVPVLTDERVPVELTSFTRAVDRLVERLRAGLEHERRFTADAAHALRHPLAVLRLELDLAGLGDDTPARMRHLARAHDALDRMQHLVTQLLTLARVQKLAGLDETERFRLVGVAKAALSDISERAAAHSIELSLDHDGNDFVLGDEGLLGILVQNLLDNALRLTPDHGQVNVRVGGTTEKVMLEVNGSGSGFPIAGPACPGDRFHQPNGSVDEGSGLGLSIVQAIATLHRGQLTFDRSSLGGARVRLTLPQAIQPPGDAG